MFFVLYCIILHCHRRCLYNNCSSSLIGHICPRFLESYTKLHSALVNSLAFTFTHTLPCKSVLAVTNRHEVRVRVSCLLQHELHRNWSKRSTKLWSVNFEERHELVWDLTVRTWISYVPTPRRFLTTFLLGRTVSRTICCPLLYLKRWSSYEWMKIFYGGTQGAIKPDRSSIIQSHYLLATVEQNPLGVFNPVPTAPASKGRGKLIKGKHICQISTFSSQNIYFNQALEKRSGSVLWPHTI